MQNPETFSSGTKPLAVNTQRQLEVKILTALNNQGSGGGGGGGGTASTVGTGAPEGVVTGSPGAFWFDTAASAFWEKISGTGNTGWVQIAAILALLFLWLANGNAQPTNTLPISMRSTNGYGVGAFTFDSDGSGTLNVTLSGGSIVTAGAVFVGGVSGVTAAVYGFPGGSFLEGDLFSPEGIDVFDSQGDYWQFNGTGGLSQNIIGGIPYPFTVLLDGSISGNNLNIGGTSYFTGDVTNNGILWFVNGGGWGANGSGGITGSTADRNHSWVFREDGSLLINNGQHMFSGNGNVNFDNGRYAFLDDGSFSLNNGNQIRGDVNNNITIAIQHSLNSDQSFNLGGYWVSDNQGNLQGAGGNFNLKNNGDTVTLGTNGASSYASTAVPGFSGDGSGLVNLNLDLTNATNNDVLTSNALYAALSGMGINALTSDVLASGSGSVVATLKNTGTAGTYTKTTFDAQGRETSGTTLAVGDIPSLPISILSSTVATNNALNGQTAGVTVATLVNGSGTNTYRVGGGLTVNAVTLDVIQFKVVYTDETATSRTQTFFPMGATTASLSATGASPFPTADIRVAANTTITVSTILTTGTGSINYDTWGNISPIK